MPFPDFDVQPAVGAAPDARPPRREAPTADASAALREQIRRLVLEELRELVR